MSESRILHAKRDNICFIRMIGKLRYTTSHGLDSWLDQMISDGEVSEILVDLSEATAIDSTNLGLLAKMARHLRQKFDHQVTLISPNKEINQVLFSMGFDKVFVILEQNSANMQEFQEIPKSTRDQNGKIEMILEAHQLLMQLNKKNHQEFQPVVNQLAAELNSSKSKRPKFPIQ